MKKKLVVFTSREILHESGIVDWRISHPKEFNEASHKEPDVKGILLEDYRTHKPNRAHQLIAEYEKTFDITVITSCLDTYHEQAGSTHVIHLFGCLEDFLPDGSSAPKKKIWLDEEEDREMFAEARRAVCEADYCVCINCRMNTYPWDSILLYIRSNADLRLIYRTNEQSVTPPIQCVRKALSTCILSIPSEALEELFLHFEKENTLRNRISCKTNEG